MGRIRKRPWLVVLLALAAAAALLVSCKTAPEPDRAGARRWSP